MFEPGTKVKLLFTQQRATVIEWMDEEVLRVRLEESGMDVPVFKDQLIRCFDAEKPNETLTNYLTEQEGETAQPPKTSKSKPKPQNKGLFIGFEPDFFLDQVPDHFRVWIINDTPNILVLSAKLQIKDVQTWEEEVLVEANQLGELPILKFDQLNDSPIFHYAVEVNYTNGDTFVSESMIKIKPKPFFNRIAHAPLLEKEVYLFEVKLSAQENQRSGEDLRTYTQKNVKPKPNSPRQSFYTPYADVSEYASFKPEIDLHLEALFDNDQPIDSRHILSTQLAHFESFMRKAIRLGVDQVFVIHGVGAGTLKNAIGQRLKQIPEVDYFKNEYHPRYGFGATEVWFKK